MKFKYLRGLTRDLFGSITIFFCNFSQRFLLDFSKHSFKFSPGVSAITSAVVLPGILEIFVEVLLEWLLKKISLNSLGEISSEISATPERATREIPGGSLVEVTEGSLVWIPRGGQSRKNLLIGKNFLKSWKKIPEETLSKYPGTIETV